MKKLQSVILKENRERVLLISVSRNPKEKWEKLDGLSEMASLAKTAGSEVVEQLIQNRKQYDAATFIGAGKAIELKNMSDDLKIDTIIFNEELTPTQKRKVEEITERKVLDRQELILDIFAQHAKSLTAKIEVELAQLKFRFHMLQGAGVTLSKLGGGIGTRGPGEQRLEVDRRRMRARIGRLEKELKRIEKSKKTQRQKRKNIFRVAIIGYTNAGKSTLMNTVSNANVMVEDKLFATLDATTRLIKIDALHRFLVTDTVGFIKNLPVQLVASFHATLEEAIEADLRLQVIDGSYENLIRHMSATRNTMEQLGIEDKRTVIVFNKIDQIPTREVVERLLRKYPDSVAISAKNGTGIKRLLSTIKRIMDEDTEIVDINFPISDGKLLAWIKERAYVIEERSVDKELFLKARMRKKDIGKIEKLKEGR